MFSGVTILTLLLLGANAEADTSSSVFVREPPNLIDFSNTTGAVVECSVRGNPTPEIIWIRSDGTAVGDVPGLRQDFVNGSLVFPPFKAENYKQEVHAQVYVCLAKNNVGMVRSRDAMVRAVVDQYYEAQVYDEFVIKGNTAVFKCRIPSYVSDHVDVISWQDMNGNKFLPSIDDYDSKYLIFPPGELHIRDVGPEDGYISYQCLTKHRLTGETRLSTTKGTLIITEPVGYVRPQLASRSIDIRISKLNETAVAFCPVQSYPVPSFRWYKFVEGTTRKQAVTLNDRVKQVAGTLIIREARVEDSGKYLCVVNNSVGGESVETVLTVTAPLKAKIEPQVQTIDFGRPAVFTCNFEGNPIKTISWLKDGHPIDHSDAVLRIESVRKEDKGMYQCFIRNDQESAEATAELKLGGRFEPPQIRHAYNEETVQSGNSVFLKCIASGNPTPEITWELYGRRLANNDRNHIGQYITADGDVVSHLNISDIHFILMNDGALGRYRCVASSKVGPADHSAIVYDEPFVKSMEKQTIVKVKIRNQTAEKSDPAVLECEAKGERPIDILWERNSILLESEEGSQYTIREEILANSVLSVLSIKRTERSNSALFTCVAINAFGSNNASINLSLLDVPEAPYGLNVLDKSGRTVQLSWVAPYDGNSPITRYKIEYKQSKLSWEGKTERVLVPGDQTEAGVFTLKPATTYHIRIIAENEIGSSEPSDTVTIITEEVPGAPPTNIRVETDDQHSLVVYWKPPVRDEWNGDILGYYVGYRLANSDNPYLFDTVEFGREEGKEHYLKISNLKTYTQYAVVVQTFNKVGAGPLSEPIKAYTAEGVPEQPPDKATCTTLTAQTIYVSWVSPPLTSANGVIKGYKVIYGPSDTWFDENTKDTKIAAAGLTILHGLKKYTNYSMEVLAYTSGGEGVRTAPIHCQTELDVPEAPVAVKALSMSVDSILVSWKPPVEPNGLVELYTVYYKPVVTEDGVTEEKPKSQKITPTLRSHNLSYQAKNLVHEKYEFWVTAATTMGEGQPSKKVTVAPSANVPAKIASFDDTFTTTYKEDVTLPCLAVGMPPPVITWKIKGVSFTTNDKIRQQPDGSLFIRDVSRNNAGEYSCHVENDFGQDSVTHQLFVNVPPHAPQVSLTSTTTNSLTLKLKSHESDVEPIHGYTIHYKPEFGDWETIQIGPTVAKYTLEKLLCGTRYQVYVKAYNSIGTGDPSDTLNPRTRGEKPIIPSAEKFIEVSSNSITLHLNAWSDGGCPIIFFVIEYKNKISSEWIQVSNNVKMIQNFVILDLDPANWYHLRVTAYNYAGFRVAVYELATLTVGGTTIAPDRVLPLDSDLVFPGIDSW